MSRNALVAIGAGILCGALVAAGVTYAWKREVKIWEDPPIQTVTVSATPVDLVPTKFCVDAAADSFPLQEAMDVWNQNGVNLFHDRAVVDQDDCIAQIQVVELPIDPNTNVWGLTQFLHKGAVFVALSTATPPDRRQQVACHELGHVLGAAHTGAASCMNVQAMASVPTPDEIREASKPWNHFNAARQAHGG